MPEISKEKIVLANGESELIFSNNERGRISRFEFIKFLSNKSSNFSPVECILKLSIGFIGVSVTLEDVLTWMSN